MAKVILDEKTEYIYSWLSKNSSVEYYREKIALEYSCKRGCLKDVQSLIQNGLECTEKDMAYAAGRGHVHIVEWLYDNANKVDLTLAIKLAVFHGKIGIIEWIKKNTYEKIDFKCLLPYSVNSKNREIWKILYEYEYGVLFQNNII